MRRSACQADRLPWSWCRCWAGWKECSCLLGPAGSLCTLCPGSWGGGRAGRAGRSPSPGLPRSSYLHHSNRRTYRHANNPALLYHVCVFGYKIWKNNTRAISSFKLWKQSKHVTVWIYLHPLWFHFLHQGCFISYSCHFSMLAVLCSHLVSIIQFSLSFTCNFSVHLILFWGVFFKVFLFPKAHFFLLCCGHRSWA